MCHSVQHYNVLYCEFGMLMRPNIYIDLNNLIRLSMVYPSQIQSQVHSLPTTEDTYVFEFESDQYSMFHENSQLVCDDIHNSVWSKYPLHESYYDTDYFI